MYSEVQTEQVWTCLGSVTSNLSKFEYVWGCRALYGGGGAVGPWPCTGWNRLGPCMVGPSPHGQNDWSTDTTENITFVTPLADGKTNKTKEIRHRQVKRCYHLCKGNLPQVLLLGRECLQYLSLEIRFDKIIDMINISHPASNWTWTAANCSFRN